MKKKKSILLKFIKETPENRKKRVSSGIKFREAVIEDKKRKVYSCRGRKWEKTIEI